MRAADAFDALFLLLEYVDRHADNNGGEDCNYDNVYHAFFLALTISAVIMPAKTATAHPPMIAAAMTSSSSEMPAEGWEVLALRYGGAMARLEDVGDEIGRYLAGKLPCMPELDEPEIAFPEFAAFMKEFA